MVLNTSFNAAGEPIVETVHDAIKTFSSLDIKYLAIGQLLLQKVESDTHLSIVTYPPTFQVSIDFEQNPLITESEIIYQLSKKASNKKISCRKKFLLFAEFVDWLIIGRKTTTIRFSNKAIDIPANNILPLIPTIDFSSKIKEKSIGYVAISKFIIKKYKDLNESDAKNDGFSTLDELKKVLKEIYKKIKDDEYVTIYTIKLINNVKNIPRN
jgi:uncharacterized protein YqfB (UPF0267 family)